MLATIQHPKLGMLNSYEHNINERINLCMKKKITSASAIFLLMLLIASMIFITACSSTQSASTSGSGKNSSESAKTTEGSTDSSNNESIVDAEAEPSVSFAATDLQGNTVRSEDIFSKNKLTMVNLWGTFCGPCIREMPDLEELNRRLKDKECAVIGVVVDVMGVNDSRTIQAAEEILSNTGVTYLNLLPWDGIFDEFPAQFIPTSYLVDAKGRIVGEPAVGARGSDDYEALIDAALAAE